MYSREALVSLAIKGVARPQLPGFCRITHSLLVHFKYPELSTAAIMLLTSLEIFYISGRVSLAIPPKSFAIPLPPICSKSADLAVTSVLYLQSKERGFYLAAFALVSLFSYQVSSIFHRERLGRSVAFSQLDILFRRFLALPRSRSVGAMPRVCKPMTSNPLSLA